MGGGRSGSGQISWVAYLEKEHKWGLLKMRNVVKEISESPAKRYDFNPGSYFGGPKELGYNAVAALKALSDTDPDEKYTSAFKAYAPLPDDYARWKKKYDDAHTYWEAESGDDYIDAMLEAYKERALDDFDTQLLPRLEVGARDINSVNTDGFLIAKTMLMKDINRDIREKDAMLHQQEHRDRQAQRMQLMQTGLGQRSVELGYSQLRAEVAMRRAAMVMGAKESVAKIADGVLSDAAAFNMKYAAIRTETSVRDHVYKAEAMKYWAEHIASISGAVPIRAGEEMSTTRAVIGGALGGAAAGYAGGGNIWAGAAMGAAAGLMG